MPITITEALADIKTTAKRIESKRAFVLSYVGRPDGIRDPLDKDGGSVESIRREEQAIGDLEARIVSLRRGIQRANDATVVEVAGVQHSISDWLVWRRDVAPKRTEFLAKLRQTLASIRQNARQQGFNVIKPGETAEKQQDVVINVDEGALARDIEAMEKIKGDLDGVLSLKNATVQIVED
jgi:hypothetical protein